ncbi:MAG: hypothetical protein J6K39_01900 [Clostridia bacterium]|nr:hypothetical protein [Clostridia bacterium]
MTKDQEIEKIVRLTLIRIGIKCDHTGFTYLEHAIKEVIENPKLLRNLRSLFTIVARQCGASSAFRVEANIHNSLVVTQKRHGFDFINTIFGFQVVKPGQRPTIGELIKLVAEYYTMGLYKHNYEYVEPEQPVNA